LRCGRHGCRAEAAERGGYALSMPPYRWVVKLKVGERDVLLLRFPVGVADVPARDSSPEILLRPVERIGCDVMLNVCSQDDTLASKVAAVAGRKYIKNRVFRDIRWLLGRGAAGRPKWGRFALPRCCRASSEPAQHHREPADGTT